MPLAARAKAGLWLGACAVAGVMMLLLFADSCQQDGGQHFLFARWAWRHPELFVGVWSRPLFTLPYAFPALLGYRAARLLTVIICLAIAWQTWRLAADLQLAQAHFAIPLTFLQPSFFLFCADTMTEPIFALTFVIALRLHLRGRVRAGMIVASLLILARPEGFFLGLLWALFVVSPSGGKGFRLKARLQTFWLATGAIVWWLAAWLITGDPLFIKHNWPANWPLAGTVYGAAGLWNYPIRLPEIVGPLLLAPFLYGLYLLLKQRRMLELTATFLLFFILHTILRAFGLLGSAGYPRYLVAIAPALAVLTLVGWNALAQLFSALTPWVRKACAAVLIALPAWLNLVYADGAEWSRDARAVEQVAAWFRAHPQPVARLLWSEPYMCIALDRDPWENVELSRDKEANRQLLQASPPGTLIFWDERVGPRWNGVKLEDFTEAGYVRLYSQEFLLKGYVLTRSWFGFGGPRWQRMHLFYKPLG